MRSPFEQRAIVGAFIWVGLIATAIIGVRQSFDNSSQSMQALGEYLTRQRRMVKLESDYNLFINEGDPIFLDGSDRVSPIGVVTEIKLAEDEIYAEEIHVAFFGASPAVCDADHLTFHYAPDSIEWLLRTMLHPAKQDEIRGLIQEAYLENHEELTDAFEPVIQDAMAEAAALIREDLKTAFASRKDQLKKIGDRYQADLIKKELVPLFQDELWPIIQEESEPLVRKVGQEIWSEVPVFSFGWRYVYDKSPLPKKQLTERKFKQFVEDKAKPILESHTDDFLELQKVIGRRISQNEGFKDAMSKSLSMISSDAEIQTVLMDVFKEVTVKNERLHEMLKKHAASPKAKKALAIANRRLDPVVRKIAISLFGTPTEGITPEFAKVLRRRILKKDKSWLTLHLDDAQHNAKLDRSAPFPESIRVELSDDDQNRPFAPAN